MVNQKRQNGFQQFRVFMAKFYKRWK